MPDWWETIKGTNPASTAGDFSESNADLDGDGYTNLEDYLNWKATPHHECAAGSSIDIDLHALARGYLATSPVFTFLGQTQGTVALISGRYARFTPTATANALGSFTFTVTDSAGDIMTRQIGVRITAATAPVLPEVTFTATDASAGESGTDQQIQFTVTRTGATTAALVVPIAQVLTTTATSGSDFTGLALGKHPCRSEQHHLRAHRVARRPRGGIRGDRSRRRRERGIRRRRAFFGHRHHSRRSGAGLLLRRHRRFRQARPRRRCRRRRLGQ